MVKWVDKTWLTLPIESPKKFVYFEMTLKPNRMAKARINMYSTVA